jgi:hypothetical protein
MPRFAVYHTVETKKSEKRDSETDAPADTDAGV